MGWRSGADARGRDYSKMQVREAVFMGNCCVGRRREGRTVGYL